MCINVHDRVSRRERGISLIEMVMFIVIVSVGIVGILGIMNITTRNSTDPMIRKQALAIAESLLEEIELQPFTYCDPDDSQATTAQSATVGVTGCSSLANVQGVTHGSGEDRYVEPRFDNVGDYGGFTMGRGMADSHIRDITGTSISSLDEYAASVAITNPAASIDGVPAGDILQISVIVTGPSNTSITLTGYRFRYAPTTVQ